KCGRKLRRKKLKRKPSLRKRNRKRLRSRAHASAKARALRAARKLVAENQSELDEKLSKVMATRLALVILDDLEMKGASHDRLKNLGILFRYVSSHKGFSLFVLNRVKQFWVGHNAGLDGNDAI